MKRKIKGLKGEEKALKACAQTSRIKILELTPDLSLEAADISLKIGLGMADSAIVDRLRNHEDPAAIFTYRALYESVNSRLDHIALLLAKRLQEKGYQAYPIPASQTIDSRKLIGVFSHKLAVNLSGLGWIGKSL